jgi:hypothetical protein
VLHRDPESNAVIADRAVNHRDYESLVATLRETGEHRAIADALDGGAKRVVFLHQLKTGGTSLFTSLAQVFPADRVCPESFERLDRFSAPELARFHLLAGHYQYSSLWRIPGRFDLITLVREPGARLLSFYYFAQSFKLSYLEKVSPGMSAIKRMSLDTFLREGAPGFLSMVGQFGDGDLNLARKRLATMTVVGLTEEFELSQAMIARRLRLPLERPRFDNVTGERTGESMFEDAPPSREPLSPALRASLAEVTRDDQVLWRAAVRRFKRQATVHWLREQYAAPRRVIARVSRRLLPILRP